MEGGRRKGEGEWEMVEEGGGGGGGEVEERGGRGWAPHDSTHESTQLEANALAAVNSFSG